MILAWSERFNSLVHIRSTGDLQSLAGAVPILVLDMAEHAYSRDFSADRTSYVETFIDNLNWFRAADRFQHAIGATVSESQPGNEAQISVLNLKEQLDAGDEILVIDVRHDDDRERYRSRIMETEYRDSFYVSGWVGDMPKDKPVVVYCMNGFWVIMKVTEELREAGINARSLSGGVVSWRAMGYPSTGNKFQVLVPG